MKHGRCWWVVALVLVSGWWSAGWAVGEPGDPASFSSAIIGVNAGQFPAIEVDVKVFSRNPVPPSRDDFEVFENQSRIASFTVSRRKPRHFLVLALDRSSSIEPAMPALKQAATSFVSLMPQDTTMAVLSFGSDVEIDQGFTADQTRLTAAIGKIRPYGGTSLYDAVWQAAEQLNNGAGRNDPRTLVVLTDGKDSNPAGTEQMSIRTRKEAVEKAVRGRVRIIAIGLGNDLDEEAMKGLAKPTGGAYLHAPHPDQLAAIYARLAERMKLEQYLGLRYVTPNPLTDGTTRMIQIVSRGSGRTDQGTSRYVAPLPPPEPPPASLAADPDAPKGIRQQLRGVHLKVPMYEDFWAPRDPNAPNAYRKFTVYRKTNEPPQFGPDHPDLYLEKTEAFELDVHLPALSEHVQTYLRDYPGARIVGSQTWEWTTASASEKNHVEVLDEPGEGNASPGSAPPAQE
ncbi:MAG: VWA domain-containing protein [Candidatus Riflebacteria bacterium]|nr:VWA domain-containing protein [Candidatus Riflebacteria bacterium]